MGLKASAKEFIRHIARTGFVLVESATRFGIDPMIDIRRLSDQWNINIETIFDVGANNGKTALDYIAAFPSARLFSFEPHPETFAQLISRCGRRKNFTGINMALTSTEGENLTLFEYQTSLINSLSDNAPYAAWSKSEIKNQTHVKSGTLDKFCADRDIKHIDILKIDTEGHDLLVLQGGADLIRNGQIRFVYVEFNDLQPTPGVSGGGLVPIDALLRPHGYRFVASYNDYIRMDRELFGVSNALFVLPPD